MIQAADLQKACAIGRDDPDSDLAPTSDDFRERVHSLAAQLMQVTASVFTPSSHTCLHDLADLPTFGISIHPSSPHVVTTSQCVYFACLFVTLHQYPCT